LDFEFKQFKQNLGQTKVLLWVSLLLNVVSVGGEQFSDILEETKELNMQAGFIMTLYFAIGLVSSASYVT